jgi:hypothetical protein
MPLPEDHQVIFLPCDDVRQEAAGKVSLLGMYSGGEIIVYAPPNEQTVLPSLSFLFVVMGGQGTFQTRFEITDPNNNPVVNHPMANSVKNANAALNIIIRMTPFPVVFGQYRVRLQLDDQSYHRTLTLIQRDLPAPG